MRSRGMSPDGASLATRLLSSVTNSDAGEATYGMALDNFISITQYALQLRQHYLPPPLALLSIVRLLPCPEFTTCV